MVARRNRAEKLFFYNMVKTLENILFKGRKSKSMGKIIY
jgi:hypothetical protein